MAEITPRAKWNLSVLDLQLRAHGLIEHHLLEYHDATILEEWSYCDFVAYHADSGNTWLCLLVNAEEVGDEDFDASFPQLEVDVALREAASTLLSDYLDDHPDAGKVSVYLFSVVDNGGSRARVRGLLSVADNDDD